MAPRLYLRGLPPGPMSDFDVRALQRHHLLRHAEFRSEAHIQCMKYHRDTYGPRQMKGSVGDWGAAMSKHRWEMIRDDYREHLEQIGVVTPVVDAVVEPVAEPVVELVVEQVMELGALAADVDTLRSWSRAHRATFTTQRHAEMTLARSHADWVQNVAVKIEYDDKHDWCRFCGARETVRWATYCKTFQTRSLCNRCFERNRYGKLPVVLTDFAPHPTEPLIRTLQLDYVNTEYEHYEGLVVKENKRARMG